MHLKFKGGISDAAINMDITDETDIYSPVTRAEMIRSESGNVVAMNDPDDDPDEEDPMLRDSYFTNKRLKMFISEGALVDGKGAIELRTNLLKEDPVSGLRTPYSKKDTTPTYGMAFELDYRAGAAAYSDDAAISPLSISDIDGKSLDVTETDVRIYKVTVSIIDPDGVEYSKMEGTKLVYK